MAATATTPRTKTRPRRSTTARKPKPRGSAAKPRPRTQRRGITPAAGFAIPAAAVGRTAVAVGGLADSGLVVRLTRSRLWIGLIGVLLVGIVGLNVYSLGLNSSGSHVAAQAEELALENSTLRSQLTQRLSNDEMQKAATKAGLAYPRPDAIGYLRADAADAKVAAKRLLGGDLAVGAVATEEAVAAEAPVAEVPVTEVPVAEAPVAPAETAPVAPVETAVLAEPVATDPAGAVAPPPVP
jgi:hypothetical protein